MKSAKALVLFFAITVAGVANAGGVQTWGHLSDALAVGLPLLAAGTAFGKGDSQGVKELTYTLGATLAANTALKSLIHEQRPDGSGNDSFPSSHTAIAFAAARFIESVVAAAADRLAVSIGRRFDASARTFRFGEGEVGGGVYFERGWLTGGLLLPALSAHLQRRPDQRLAECVATVRGMLLERLGRSGPGLPTHWRIAEGRCFAEHREEQTAEAAFLLEALPLADLQRLLRRAAVGRAVEGLPSPDDPDIATQLSLLARCGWVWR